MRMFVATMITLAVCSCRPTPIAAQAPSTSCLTNADTAAGLAWRVRTAVGNSDSTDLAHFGLSPSDTTNIQLVTDSDDCANAVSAYVREKPATSDWPAMQAAYVFRLEGNRYIVFDARGVHLGKSDIMIFDSSWTLLGWLTG